jgi:hypothetical protein
MMERPDEPAEQPPAANAAKKYSSPKLTRYGSIESLTQSGSSTDLDGQNHRTGNER